MAGADLPGGKISEDLGLVFVTIRKYFIFYIRLLQNKPEQ